MLLRYILNCLFLVRILPSSYSFFCTEICLFSLDTFFKFSLFSWLWKIWLFWALVQLSSHHLCLKFFFFRGEGRNLCIYSFQKIWNIITHCIFKYSFLFLQRLQSHICPLSLSYILNIWHAVIIVLIYFSANSSICVSSVLVLIGWLPIFGCVFSFLYMSKNLWLCLIYFSLFVKVYIFINILEFGS